MSRPPSRARLWARYALHTAGNAVGSLLGLCWRGLDLDL